MSTNVRWRFMRALALVGPLLLAGPALAADYSVDFGAEIGARKDAGTLDCQFAKSCRGELESLGLWITFLVFRSDPERLIVHMYGSRDIICCYFAYAADKVVVDPRRRIAPVPFFKGGGARGGLYIENKRVGTLYLRFNSHLDPH